ncbi:U-box domain-containing protein 35-like [Silene latifolia]|uniref:U-box domain-containing protein 35-like n=1 Tax=Silene latifolia TaxID=37657 RepID=UPI003D7703AF
MEKGETDKDELVVAIGLSGSRKGKLILKWAVEKFVPEGKVRFRIIRVYPKITTVPTPIGTWLPVSQVTEDVANTYRQEIGWKKMKALLPYQQSLKAQKVKSDIVVLESDDIALTLCSDVNKNSIRHLVVGPSSTSIFSRKTPRTGDQSLSAVISENAPSFCSVYVVADGKLQYLRASESEPTVISVPNTNGSSSTLPDSTSGSSSLTIGRVLKTRPSSPRCKWIRASSLIGKDICDYRLLIVFSYTHCFYRPRLRLRFFYQQLQTRTIRTSPKPSGCTKSNYGASGYIPLYPESFTSTPPGGSFAGNTPTGSFVGTPPTGSYMGTPPTGSYMGTSPNASFVGTHQAEYVEGITPRGTQPQRQPPASPEAASQGQIYELEKLRMELRHVEKMYELAQNNNIDEKLNTLSKERLEAALKHKEEAANEIANTEKHKHIAEQYKAESGKNGQGNKPHHKEKKDAAQKAEDSENKLQQLLASPVTQCQKFSWSEILEATSSLSQEFRIGAGAFGTVFKCKLHHTTVAVKVLHSKDTVTNKQFLQELEILSTIRHPHLLLLLGAVPEESCLVYEYMENGSLDDRLFRKDNCPPLPWYERIRICWEVASALAFLHSTKPRPIIHRDLKPANILLDNHLVSKIGDAGLGTTITMEPNEKSLKTLYKETSPVGTLCYIDPEYQRTGRVSTKSDVYALGVVILQLLTTKPAVGIAYLVEDAVEEGTLTEILDKEAGKWPDEAAQELASLGLLCSELRGRDRPDLREVILPTLERLKEVADKAREQIASAPPELPAHFICPISKEVMDDPYVAADGYTYNRAAIEKWLAENSTSPTTNLPLPHKFIMPNYTILEAIKQWKSKQLPN